MEQPALFLREVQEECGKTKEDLALFLREEFLVLWDRSHRTAETDSDVAEKTVLWIRVVDGSTG